MMDKNILRQAAAEADAALMEGLPAPEDCSADFSPEFEQKLARRLVAEKPSYGAVKRAACILLAFVLVGGSLLAASPTVRAAALGWLRESYGTVSMYLFQEKTCSSHFLRVPAATRRFQTQAVQRDVDTLFIVGCCHKIRSFLCLL